MNVGGPLKSITLNGRYFSVAAEGKPKLSLANNINSVRRFGDGSCALIEERTGWSLKGAVLSIDLDRDDLGFLSALRDASNSRVGGVDDLERFIAGGISPRPRHESVQGVTELYAKSQLNVAVEIEMVTGTTYSGHGVPVGPLEADIGTSTIAVDFEGHGEMIPIGGLATLFF